MIARFALLISASLLASCGYHVAGHSDLLPSNLQTIAIPAFHNITARYKLSEKLPAALSREFLTRTRYRVVTDENAADAVLRGAVINYQTFPIVSDQNTGRATVVQVIVTLQMSLTERQTGKILYNRPTFEIRQRYEISIDPNAYFEENELALDRLTRDVARMSVSAILEAF